jgi:hypothetical protein
VLARLASGGARVVAAVIADGHVLADVRRGVGSKEQRELLLDDEPVEEVDAALQHVPALVEPLQCLVRARDLFDLRWLDKGTAVEPHAVCLVAEGDRVALHVEHRDFKTGRLVPSWPSGVLLQIDAATGGVRAWQRVQRFEDTVASL